TFAVLDDLQQPLLHRAGRLQAAFQVEILLRNVLTADLLALQLSALAEFFAEVEDEPVERFGRNPNHDRAFHLAVGEFLTVDRGDVAALDLADQLRDICDGGVEGFDFEFDVARANDLASDDRFLNRGRIRRRLRRWISQGWRRHNRRW